MVNIFYNKTTLNDTLIINLHFANANKVENHNNYSLMWSDDKLVGINIFNASQHINLEEGFLYCDSTLIAFIKKITNLDLSANVEKNFVVGKVLKCSKVENTHLNYCEVDVKDKILNIICGANNVKENIKVVVANVNTVLPSGKKIVKSKIQGYESSGMLCSNSELNLASEQKSGIIILENEYQTGDLFVDVFANKINYGIKN
ncbi:MAG: tRNA-binding protein [Malacoplasma sp.]|nr:tRNA-binding protein [Malacoplasma sp.]